MSTHRVLITGASGVIGRIVARELLSRGHAVRGLDLAPNPELADNHVGSITDSGLVERAAESMDTLVHLAAVTDDADFLAQLLPNNVMGLFHVMDAARRHGFRRVVLASSVQVISGMADKAKLPHPPEGPAPRNHYAVTKVLAESMGLMYALEFKMSVVAARIGWLHRNVESVRRMAQSPWGTGSYFSHRDAARFFCRAVEAEPVSYALLFALSKPPRPELAERLVPARDLIGYEPEDRFPQGLDFAVPPDVLERHPL